MNDKAIMKFNKVLWAILLIFIFIFCLLCANLNEIASVFSSFFLFCLPGPLFLQITTNLNRTDVVVFGSAIGLGFSCLFVTLFLFAFGWHIGLIILCLLCVSLILFCINILNKKNTIECFSIPEWSNEQFLLLAVTLIVVLSAIFLPFINIGKLTEDGYAYTWLIGQDFLWRVSVSFSVARGLPAESFDFANNYMNYYVLFYALPSFAYNLLKTNASMESTLLVTQILLSVFFVTIFFSTFRAISKRTLSLVFVMVTSFIACSYLWVVFVLQRGLVLIQGSDLYDKILSFDILASILKGSAHSHGFYRFLIVQPHVLVALGLFLMCIYFLFASADRFSFKTQLLMGLSIGCIWGFELSIGLISASIITGYYMIMFVFHSMQRTEMIKKMIVFVLGFALMLWVLTPLGMYSKSHRPGGTVEIFTKNSDRIIKNIITAPVYIPVEYGAAAIFTFFGLFFLWRKKRFSFLNFPVIFLSITLLFFCIISKITGPIKLMRFLPIAFALVSAYIIDSMHEDDLGKWKKSIVIFLIVLAVPSFFVDIFIGSNVANRHNTLYVSKSDMDAAEWIKQNTNPEAMIQGYPHYYTENTNRLLGYNHKYSLISCFADRKAYLGRITFAKRLFSSKRDEIRHRSELINEVFQTQDISVAAKLCTKSGIDYVYFGMHEKKRYPTGYQKFEIENKYFQKVYDQKGVSIYLVNTI